MLFNTDIFIFLFLPGTLIGFFILGHIGVQRASLLWLVVASLFYYGWWNPAYLALVGGSMAFNYTIAQYIYGANSIGNDRRAKFLTFLGVLFNLSLLGYFKYANFFLESLSLLSGAGFSMAEIVLPVGISFFTFQQIAYLVDTKQGKAGQYDFVEYSLFVLFFPQLIAGPIVHHREMLPQFANAHTYKPSLDNISIGGTIFAIGLFKKVVLADNLALVASPVFAAAEAGEAQHFFAAWEATFAYGLQLYFDFSGYSDMAIGAARMFGIRLPINFDSPYQATGIVDFWRRWHMTLSRFLGDYVYIPLGGNRKGKPRRFINLFATMLLGGLWHGAGWGFILWGCLHGLFLIINHGWRAIMGAPNESMTARFVARLFTMFVVMLAWVPFRAQTMDGALAIYSGMLTLPAAWLGHLGPLGEGLGILGFDFSGPAVNQSNLESLLWLAGWIAVLWCLPNTQQALARFSPAHNYDETRFKKTATPFVRDRAERLLWKPGIAWGAVVGLMLALAVLSLNQVSEFLYYQF